MTDKSNSKKNLYQIAIDDILNKINKNEFSFENPICTEKQLMDEYNFSRITAKRAITELEHMGIVYRKRGVGSFVSRNIHLKSTQNSSGEIKLFAFILPFACTKGGLFETVQTINNILSTQNSYLSIHITDKTNTKAKHILNDLHKQNISGLVFYPFTNNIHLELLNKFIVNEKPVVILDKSHESQYLSSVLSDNYTGGVMLTDYLISLGHTNIAFLSSAGASGLTSVCDRFGGYLHSIKNAGIKPKEENIFTNLSDLYVKEKNTEQYTPTIKETVKHLYDIGVTAIEAENDEVAFAVMLACKELSIKVPEEMSICGFDNSEWAHMSDPGITTIKQNFHEIGRIVAEIFLESLKDSHAVPKRVILPVELIIQGSTGPIRSSSMAELKTGSDS